MKYELTKREATRRAFLIGAREIYIAEASELERRISCLRLTNFSSAGHMLAVLHRCCRRNHLRGFAFVGCSLRNVGRSRSLFALALFQFVDTFFQAIDAIKQALDRWFSLL